MHVASKFICVNSRLLYLIASHYLCLDVLQPYLNSHVQNKTFSYLTGLPFSIPMSLPSPSPLLLLMLTIPIPHIDYSNTSWNIFSSSLPKLHPILHKASGTIFWWYKPDHITIILSHGTWTKIQNPHCGQKVRMIQPLLTSNWTSSHCRPWSIRLSHIGLLLVSQMC